MPSGAPLPHALKVVQGWPPDKLFLASLKNGTRRTMLIPPYSPYNSTRTYDILKRGRSKGFRQNIRMLLFRSYELNVDLLST